MFSLKKLLNLRENNIRKKLATTTLQQRQELLKTSALNLSKFSATISRIKEWGNQALVISSFLGAVHPLHSKWLPMVNSSISMLIDKFTMECLEYKIAEFRYIAVNCMPGDQQIEQSEQALRDISQLLLNLELPKVAKEILTDLALAIEVKTNQELIDLNYSVFKHHRKVTLLTATLAA